MKVFGQTGSWDFVVSIAREPGIGAGSPVLVEEAIVEGSGEVCYVDFNGTVLGNRG